MVINGVRLSEGKLQTLSAILPEEVLRNEYEIAGLNDREIAGLYGLSQSWVSKLRRVYGVETDPRYYLRRNPLRHVKLTDYQRDFLYGSLLGDSCIATQKSGSGYWLCRHSTKQEKYLLKQAEIMKPFTAKVFYGKRPFVKGGKEFPYVDARTFALPQFTEFRNELYPDGVKTITADWLQRLTPTGFSYWYMDDGSTTGYGFDITTYDSFFRTEESIEVLADVLNLKVSINWNGDEGLIHVLRESYDTAWEYVRDNLTEDLFHKIPIRFKDNQQPSLDGNVEEGSTTGGSLNSFEYGDNTRLEEVTFQGTPDTSMVMIQSELAGNCER